MQSRKPYFGAQSKVAHVFQNCAHDLFACTCTIFEHGERKMDEQKQMFEEFCKVTFMDDDSKGSKSISRAKGENIIRLLKKERDMNDYTPKFRHWVKSKGLHCSYPIQLWDLRMCCVYLQKLVQMGSFVFLRHLAWQCYRY